MRWFLFPLCLFVAIACSDKAAKITPQDGDTIWADSDLLADSDELLVDGPVNDLAGPDAADTVVTDDATVIPDGDTIIPDNPVADDTPLTDDDSLLSDDPVNDDPVTDDFIPDDVQPDADAAPFCGDGIKNNGEACDDGLANNGKYGYCNAICTGPGPRCGDGNPDTGYEECDEGDALNGTYEHCADDCQGLGPRCGDGVTQDDEGELCDDGELLNGTYDHCNDTCSGDGPYCGDGVVDTDNEDCDKSKDQYCLGKEGGCGSGAEYRLRKCDNATCTWQDWSNCGYSDGQDADNFGDCPSGFEC